MKSFIVSLMLVSLAACNGGGGGGGDKGSASPGGSTGSTTASIKGIWQVCENTDFGWSYQRLYTFTEDAAIVTLDLTYSDPDCSGVVEYEEVSTGSYSLGGSRITADLSTYVYTPRTQGDVDYNNNNSYCGRTDWALNQPKSLIGLNCGLGVIPAVTTSLVDYSLTPTSLTLTYDDGEQDIFNLIVDFNFVPKGQTLANGNYYFSTGDLAFYATIDTGAYQFYLYDTIGKRYFREFGTQTNSNNMVNGSVGGYSPSNCYNDIGSSLTYSFTVTDVAVAWRFNSNGDALVLIPTVLTEAQFRSAVLGGGYTLSCF